MPKKVYIHTCGEYDECLIPSLTQYAAKQVESLGDEVIETEKIIGEILKKEGLPDNKMMKRAIQQKIIAKADEVWVCYCEMGGFYLDEEAKQAIKTALDNKVAIYFMPHAYLTGHKVDFEDAIAK